MNLRSLLVLPIVGTSIVSAQADDVETRVTVGWRDVSVSGANTKYAEDVNLSSGLRLREFNVIYRPNEGQTTWLDVAEIDVQNIGGEPSESLRLDVTKYGAYRFVAQRTRSDYVYDDTLILASEASISGSTGGDFHRFDLERTTDKVGLDLDIGEHADIGISFERINKEGASTTTLDVQRDEFELDKPIDESLHQLRLQASYKWSNATFYLEERIREFENNATWVLPGFSAGHNVTDSATLDAFLLTQPYEYKSREHIVRLAATPSEKITLKFGAVMSDLDLNVSTTEQAQGVNFQGAPFSTDVAGLGAVGRDFSLFDIDVIYTLSDRVQFIAGAHRRNADQFGVLTIAPDENEQSRWQIDTVGFDVGAVVALSPVLTVSAGWNSDRRTVDTQSQASSEAVIKIERTHSDSFFGTMDYRPSERFSLSASIGEASIDDPFTLASATDSNRLRLRAKYRVNERISLLALYNRTERENKAASWSATTAQRDVRLAYNDDSLNFSIGVSKLEWARDFLRQVVGGTRQDDFDVAYRSDALYLHANARWQVSQRWAIAADYKDYDNDGSFAVERNQLTGIVDIALSGHHRLRFSYRNIDFVEDQIESYDADIIECLISVNF